MPLTETKSLAIIDLFLKELEQEATTTRKMLAVVPNDKYDWQPHPKSMSIKRLATHIGELPSWISMTLTTEELDFAANPYQQPNIDTTHDLLAYFERSYAAGKAALEKATEEQLLHNWTLRNGEEIYSVSTKAEVIRMSFSQLIHHRAQLGVFLRLLNVPIPGSYGPSADDLSF
ncbi:MAG: DinB family protein [Chitinophagaceae bacterium]|nr:DinB family protein [Chitinophagaceae bacterium]